MKSVLTACICCALLPVLQCQVTANIPEDHRFFLRHLFLKYGHNGIISFEGFEHLLENLGIGGITFDSDHTFVEHKNADGSFQEIHDVLKVHDHFHKRVVREANKFKERNHTEDEDLEAIMEIEKRHDESMQGLYYKANENIPTQCMSARDLLVAYGMKPDHELSLSPTSFLHICPAIIFELDQKTCTNQKSISASKDHSSPLYKGDVKILWLWASLTIVFISIAGLLGIAVVPLLQKSFFTQLLNFLVALAVGTLSGDALLHLLPHSFKSDTNDEMETVLKAGFTFLTIIAFFFLEAILRATRKVEEEEEDPVDAKGQYSIVDLQITEKGPIKIEKPKETHTHAHKPVKDGSIASVAFMVIMGDGMHNLTDGLAIGAAFSGGIIPGFATSVAVFTHELPHELGDFAVLLTSGMSVKQAMFYNIVSSVLSFVGMVGGMLLGNFGSATQWIYAATAGSFIYIALADLVPEMNKNAKAGNRPVVNVFLQLAGILCGGGIMCVIAIYEEDLHNLFG